MTARGTVLTPHKVPLSPAHLAQLRALVAERGTDKTARLLKCGALTVTELVTGG